MEASGDSEISAEVSLGSFTDSQGRGLRSMEEMGLVFDSREEFEKDWENWSIGRVSLKKASQCCLKAVSFKQMSQRLVHASLHLLI